jgi:hypothetical protein
MQEMACWLLCGGSAMINQKEIRWKNYNKPLVSFVTQISNTIIRKVKISLWDFRGFIWDWKDIKLCVGKLIK